MVWLTNTLQAMLIHYFYPDRMAANADEVKARAEAQVAPMLDQLDAELARHGGPGSSASITRPWTRWPSCCAAGRACRPTRPRPGRHLAPI